MEQVTVENFRCFREKQTARLAPLTLLVGDNSTGKTSFLALIRALWDIGYHRKSPSLKAEPYDLGNFDEIANRRTKNGLQTEIVQAGFSSSILIRKSKRGRNQKKLFEVEISLSKKGVTPVVSRLFYRSEKTWIEEFFENEDFREMRVGTYSGSWKWKKPRSGKASFRLRSSQQIPFVFFDYLIQQRWGSKEIIDEFKPVGNSPDFTGDDLESINDLATFRGAPSFESPDEYRPFASAPARSRPYRIYERSQPTRDPQGDYMPMYLANTYFEDEEKWILLKNSLEEFGQSSGLFDEISIEPLDIGTFRVQIRKFNGRAKGLQRNLVDVGYGVSQILPVIVELLREDITPMFLLQQPEMHLHPSAQAALGSFFCENASWNRQVIIETHSDYLLDRIRTDVRDGNGNLKPEDISILFFERDGLDVRIHSIRVDQEGDILDAPSGYRDFFMRELDRSVGV